MWRWRASQNFIRLCARETGEEKKSWTNKTKKKFLKFAQGVHKLCASSLNLVSDPVWDHERVVKSTRTNWPNFGPRHLCVFARRSKEVNEKPLKRLVTRPRALRYVSNKPKHKSHGSFGNHSSWRFLLRRKNTQNLLFKRNGIRFRVDWNFKEPGLFRRAGNSDNVKAGLRERVMSSLACCGWLHKDFSLLPRATFPLD